MKKLLSVLCVLIICAFGFVYAEESGDTQSHFLPSLDNEDESGILDALQDSTDIITQENEKIAQEEVKKEREKAERKERIAQEKKQKQEAKRKPNNFLNCISFGANFPFNLNTEIASNKLYDTPFPLGISAQYTSFVLYFAFKTNLNWDFVKYTEGDTAHFLWTVSLGLTPIHNDICFVGIYGTLGFPEKIEDYSYTSFGASANVLYNFSDNFGLSITLDATYRSISDYNGDKEIAPYIPHYLDTWRVSPSIGFFYTFIKG